MLSHVLCILPQETTLLETGPQRDPNESWREETHRSFYTYRVFYAEKSLHKGVFYIQKVLHREAFTRRSFCRQTSRSFYTQKFLHEEIFTQRVFYTQTRLHTEVSTQRSLYTEEFLHTKAFTHSKFLHTHRGFYTEKPLHRGFFYTQKVLHREMFTLRSFCAQTSEFLHTAVVTQRSLYTESF